eukprot:jgi/Tetstr1/429563/TSEL_019463.t1
MSMPYCEASHLGNTTVLAMFVAVMVWASNRYRRKVTAMSKAGLGATRGFHAKSAVLQLPIAEGDGHETAFWGSGRHTLVGYDGKFLKQVHAVMRKPLTKLTGNVP